MADINKSDVKLMQSQRLDDTEYGGGQMTSYEVLDGEVNNLFPDISRLDRVYGRVSMRKAYLAVQTSYRETYYGSHTILIEQVSDPNVSVCFFSSEDWFDVRDDAKNRIESYLVRGPLAQLSLWGTHYVGTSVLNFLSRVDVPDIEIGEVIVLKDSEDEQYIRIIDLVSEEREFFRDVNSIKYNLKVITMTIGNAIDKDYIGVEADPTLVTSDDPTLIHTTVAADASRYFGVAKLAEEAAIGTFQFRVDDIMTPLVPSAASESAITDAGVGVSVAPIIQTADDENVTVTRSIQFLITDNAKLYIGEGIQRGSLNWSGGGLTLTDDKDGNVLSGSLVVGTIYYPTGTISFGEPGVSSSGTGSVTYIPATAPSQVSETGAINISTSNRGFVYTYNCDPIPEPGTLKVEYMSGGKWYTLWDQGNGKISGLEGYNVGSGTLNFTTGTASVTLKASPDVDSKVLFFWAKPAEYYDFSGETLPIKYKFTTANPAVARNTFVFSWIGDGQGDGPDGNYGIVDNGNGDLVLGEFDLDSWVTETAYIINDNVKPIVGNSFAYKCTVDGISAIAEPIWPVVVGETVIDGDITWECIAIPSNLLWTPVSPESKVGEIEYATGNIDTGIHASQDVPTATEVFSIKYNYGDPETQIFAMPPREGDGTIILDITNTPIVPGTFRIEWHTDIVLYEILTRLDPTKDPAYIFRDDSNGFFDGDINDGTTNWMKGTVDYSTGIVQFMPDRATVFPNMVYDWKETEWLHPGVIESRVFSHIQYIETASIFPPDRSVTVQFCTTDGANLDEYTGTIVPIYEVEKNSGLEIIPGGLSIDAGANYLIDNADGKLYTHIDGVEGNMTQVGTVNYQNKTFTITSDSIDISSMYIRSCVGGAAIDPTMFLVFRAPGAPIRSGSAFFKATNSEGDVIEGQAGQDGIVIGDGISGSINHNNGLCQLTFGKYVTDDAAAQSQDWYNINLASGGLVWKPYIVRASSILMNCVVTSYLPLDPDLLGLNPVRLPLDGRVPIFRDGYIVVVHHSQEETMTHPMDDNGDPLVIDLVKYCGRTDVDLLEVYTLPTDYQKDEGTQVVPKYVTEVGNYTVNLDTGNVTFLSGYELPKDERYTDAGTVTWVAATHFNIGAFIKPSIDNKLIYECTSDSSEDDTGITAAGEPTWPTTEDLTVVDGDLTWTCIQPANQLILLSRVEDMALASDVQITGHIAITSALTRTYPANETIVSSVLPSADMQSRAYGEFEQSSWNNIWSNVVDGTPPLASYNFVDYPITVTNRPSIKERWLILFTSSTSVSIIGENFGVLTQEDVSILTGNVIIGGHNCIAIENRQFPGEYYFVIRCDGFGSGWQSGNCIRFNQDAANFPLWFIRTTLQAPPTEPIDHYTIQIRGDSS